ncbi:hypothetical protein ACIA98_40880 [Streptomyces sp. NPDC051366]|uniref:hypothetical protein n=1 Tax=Streptomyces sp. NPDC051366 TaxID=3365652 RepID=UPI00379D2F57
MVPHVRPTGRMLGMSDPDHVELWRVGQDLHAEAISPNPEPDRLRQFATPS